MLGGNYPCLVLKLRRKVMFYLVKKLGLDICYRCGNKIEEEKELSLDHSEPWMYKSNALEIFMDETKIVFSHKSCNYRSRRQNISRFTKDGYKGVIKIKKVRSKKIWVSMVYHKRKQIFLGSFITPEEAAKAYDEAAIRIYGERAVTNKSLGLIK